ncbi:MAG: prepilin peptidase [Tissierellia bacterium]|nr:prepilin peptidase [Tissierellia bacterium]
MILKGLLGFILGSILGSFSNVIVYRTRENISIVTPNSFCENCHYSISWYEKIPIISYIFLKGRCSNCNAKIGRKHFIIELASGVLLSIVFLFSDNRNELIFLTIIFPVVVSISLIDIEELFIYDSMLMYIGIISLVFMLVNRNYEGIISFCVSCAIYFFIYTISNKAIGSGDILLSSLLALNLTPLKLYYFVSISFILGGIVALVFLLLRKANKDSKLAFAPFINISFFIVCTIL